MLKALIIHPHRIEKMGNLDAVAQALGREAFHTKNNVTVFPWVGTPKIRGVDYLVVVVEDGNGNP